MLDSNMARWVGFGLGHVLNDLAACGWFSFFLVYLTHVLRISDFRAGLLLLIGQVADALATPVMGLLSDRWARHSVKRRKQCLGLGSVIVGLGYPLLYAPWGPLPTFAFLTGLVIVFQFAWAGAQISHLALITDLARDSVERTLLNSIRFGATVCSNFAVFFVAFFIFHSGRTSVGPEDADAFWQLALSISGMGLLCLGLSLALLRAPERPTNAGPKVAGKPRRAWWEWFLLFAFWRAAVLYMCSRLIANTIQVYLQLYALEVLSMHPRALALVPAAFFAGQMCMSTLIPTLRRFLSSDTLFALGSAQVVIGCAAAYSAGHGAPSLIYAAAVVLGLGCGAVMVSSLSVVADLISAQTSSAAWVYGLMSFSDKLSGGLVLMAIQRGLAQCGGVADAVGCRAPYLVGVMTTFPSATTALALLALASSGIATGGQTPGEDERLIKRHPALTKEAAVFTLGHAHDKLPNCFLPFSDEGYGWGHWDSTVDFPESSSQTSLQQFPPFMTP